MQSKLSAAALALALLSCALSAHGLQVAGDTREMVAKACVRAERAEKRAAELVELQAQADRGREVPPNLANGVLPAPKKTGALTEGGR